MTEHSYLTVRVDDCPAGKRKVARLLAGYGMEPGGHDDDAGLAGEAGEVAIGADYVLEQAPLGSAGELAGMLIRAAPRCSFRAWRDPYSSAALGDVAAYTPLLGRFDGKCTGAGMTVVRDYRQVSEMLVEAGEAGIGGEAGARAVVEVAYGVPWLEDWHGHVPSSHWRKLWLRVIDVAAAAAARRRDRELEGILAEIADSAARATSEGPAAWALDAAAQAVRAAPVPARFAAARALQARHGAAFRLGEWADRWETVWEGRRRNVPGLRMFRDTRDLNELEDDLRIIRKYDVGGPEPWLPGPG